MHGGDLCEGWILQVDVQGLALVDERSSADGQVDQLLLRQFPDCPEELSGLFRDLLDALDGAVLGQDLVSDLAVPEVLKSDKRAYHAHQDLNQMLVDADELSTQDSSGVQVGGDGLEGLGVAQDLRGAGSWTSGPPRESSSFRA